MTTFGKDIKVILFQTEALVRLIWQHPTHFM
jgi:hypothetical protein